MCFFSDLLFGKLFQSVSLTYQNAKIRMILLRKGET